MTALEPTLVISPDHYTEYMIHNLFRICSARSGSDHFPAIANALDRLVDNLQAMAPRRREIVIGDNILNGRGIGQQGYTILSETSSVVVGKGATFAIQNCIAETDHQRREKAATVDHSRARNTSFVVHGAHGPPGHAPSRRRERATYAFGMVYPFPDIGLVKS